MTLGNVNVNYMNQFIKYIIVISPPILLIMLFHVYWWFYAIPYNLNPEKNDIPYDIYWSYIVMVAVSYALFASINFIRKKNLWTLRMHFQNKILIRNILFTYILMLLFGNAMFILRHLKPIESNVCVHTIVLVFANVFIVQSLVFKFGRNE